MSLARLWQRQGKRADACQLLAEVYGWFTEGFDTADLQDAGEMLVWREASAMPFPAPPWSRPLCLVGRAAV